MQLDDKLQVITTTIMLLNYSSLALLETKRKAGLRGGHIHFFLGGVRTGVEI